MIDSLPQRLVKKETKLSVTGLGYVGLPLAQAFATELAVVGFDTNPQRVITLSNGEDLNQEQAKGAFANLDICYTTDENRLDEADFHIVAVPTPIDAHNNPDLALLKSATAAVARHLRRGNIVVFESTVYPACTEDVCIPILEEKSGLRCGTDFGVGYSPERINPGDSTHTVGTVVKIVSGTDEATCNAVAEVYGLVCRAGIHRAPSIKVAEAAKIIENTQRDVNIALMNELSIIFSRMGIDTGDVIEAASTKWNFMPFRPGLVGGHCIGVDPYYLDYKAAELGYHTQIINRGRYVNDSMGKYVAKMLIKHLGTKNVELPRARVLLMGFAYKENVRDVRNTRSMDIYNELRSYGVPTVDVYDPLARPDDCLTTYGLRLCAEPTGAYDAIVVAVAHDVFKALGQPFFDRHLKPGGSLFDVKGIYRHLTGIDMWRL